MEWGSNCGGPGARCALWLSGHVAASAWQHGGTTTRFQPPKKRAPTPPEGWWSGWRTEFGLDARRVGLRPLRAFTRLARRNFPGHLPVAYTNHDFSSSSEESGEADESSEESSEEAEESSESEQGESDAEWTTVKSRKRPQSDEPPGPSGRSEPKRSKRADELAALGEAEDRR